MNVRIAAIASTVLMLGVAQPALAQDEGAAYAESLGITADIVSAACKDGRMTIYSLILDDEDKHPAPEFGKHFPCPEVQFYEVSRAARAERYMHQFMAGPHLHTQDSS